MLPNIYKTRIVSICPQGMWLSTYVGDRPRLISSLSSSAFSVTFLCCLKCTNSAQKCTLLQLLYLKGLIFLKIAESFGIFQFYSLYQIDKIPPDSFKAEMKDNEANTRQNSDKNLYTNGNCFSQLMTVIGAKLFNRRRTPTDADNDWMLAH